MRHWNNGTDHCHSKSCCDKSSPARRTIKVVRHAGQWIVPVSYVICLAIWNAVRQGNLDVDIFYDLNIILTSHERHCTSNQQKLDCWLNNLFRIAKKTLTLCITGSMLGESTVDWGDFFVIQYINVLSCHLCMNAIYAGLIARGQWKSFSQVWKQQEIFLVWNLYGNNEKFSAGQTIP